MTPVFLVVVLLQSLAAATGAKANTESLQLLHVVWRHADRAPSQLDLFPNDPNNSAASWHHGLFEISRLGIRQQFLLGQYIKNRYRGFLGEEYSSFELNVQSEGSNMTIMSAESNCAGLYPPRQNLSWNETWMDLHRPGWFPVPIHATGPPYTDPMLNPYIPCPTADLLDAQLMSTPAVQRIWSKHAKTVAFLRQKTGLPLLTLLDIGKVYETLLLERIHSPTHTWPSWMNESLWREVQHLQHDELECDFTTVGLQRLRGGLLLGDIMRRMNAKASGSLDARFKYQAYSTFHGPIFALLRAFGAQIDTYLPFSSAIFIELHREGGSYFVELYLYNDTAHAPYPLAFGACGFRCELGALTRAMKAKIPTDWQGECGLETLASANAEIETLRRYVIALAVVLACFVAIGVALGCARMRRACGAGRKEGYLEMNGK